MPHVRSEIPVGTQFSPELVDLGEFLRSLIANSGDRPALQRAIWSPPVHLKPPHGVPSSRRRANLPLEAAVQYSLLDPRSYTVTGLTRKLALLPKNQRYDEFARHILLNCGGLRVVEAVQQMQADGLNTTADSLAQYLTDQGFRVTVHNTAINSLRMWLARAGIFSPRGWEVDPAAKERVLGLSDEALGILAELDDEQRAFVQALCQINPTGWYKAADVRDLAEATSARRLSRVSLPQRFLHPLKIAQLIDYRTKGTAGGKSAMLKTTDKFKRDVLETFAANASRSLDKALVAYYHRRPLDIYKDLASTDRFRKGQALEAYAIHIMRLLGLRFLAWRRRARDTGGAEVDVVLAGLFGGIPTRWQVQCKNTPGSRLHVEDIAREVGVAVLNRATHILIIANCNITKYARNFATGINNGTTFTLFQLDKRDFEAVKASPGVLGDLLRTKAEEILRQRAPLATP